MVLGVMDGRWTRVAAACALATLALAAADSAPWFDVSLPVRDRVGALVDAMTDEEVVQQLVVYAPAIPRLGLPGYTYWSEGLHGVAWAGAATVFPTPVGLAATFDAALIHRVGKAVGFEARAKHHAAMGAGNSSGTFQGLSFFAPNINILRDPRWGRGLETYGEDPYLSALMANAYVRGLQGDARAAATPNAPYLLAAATCKHFVGYSVDSEPPRLSFAPRFAEADLLQTFLPAFSSCVRSAGAAMTMCAYSGVNGVPMCASPLLNGTLRGQLGADEGHVVVSDCAAIEFLQTEYQLADNATEADRIALAAGVDLDCGDYYKSIDVASSGTMASARTSLRRVLQQRFR